MVMTEISDQAWHSADNKGDVFAVGIEKQTQTSCLKCDQVHPVIAALMLHHHLFVRSSANPDDRKNFY